MQPNMGLSSPPTPMSHHSDTRRTRSGRSIVRNDSPHSTSRSSPPRTNRKKKASANDKNKTPKLTAPLSVLTKDMVDVPVKDMEAWVKRPVEDRLAEAEKRNGYITRPMNSFMLYRSAYADRTKMWCLHNNHQVVSSVSGESWPLEPMEVREFYNELAKIERINHQNAHPNYKFSPSKPGGASAASKKRGRSEPDDDSEPSDLDDPDWGRENGVRSRPSKRSGRDAGYPARANLGDAQGHFHHEVYNRTPSWETQVRPPPQVALPYQQMPHPQQFYPSPTMQHHHVQMMPTPQHQQQDPFSSFDNTSFPTNQSLIGMPGGNHAELLGLHSNNGTPAFDHQVDPFLLAMDERAGMSLEDSLALAQHNAAASNFDAHSFGQEQHSLAYNPNEGAGGPLISDYRPKEWAPETTSPTFEDPAGSEFDRLWDDQEMNRLEERKASFKSHFEDHNLGGAVQAIGTEDGLKSPKSS